MHVADRPASPIHNMYFFSGPTILLLLIASQHNTTQLDSFLGPWIPHVGGLSGCWNTSMEVDRKLSAHLAGIYYNPRGYWQGLAAIKNLSAAANVTEQHAKDWLKKQAVWKIYLPAPRPIPRPKFDVAVTKEVHQADLLCLPHDRVGRKKIRYALTVVDVASRYKEAEHLTSKTAAEVADGLARIYKRSPLGWPKLLQVDPRRQFTGSVRQLWQSTLSRFGAVGLTSTGTKASRSASKGR